MAKNESMNAVNAVEAVNNVGVKLAPTPNQQLIESLNDAMQHPVNDVIHCLSVEQRSALESKFLALPQEIRSAVSAQYSGFSNVALYIIRQMKKEANGKLASNLRPVWYNKLVSYTPSLDSGDENVRNWAEKQLKNLAEDLDVKESATLIKKYKNQHDMTTASPTIIRLCGIFGIEVNTVK